MADLTFKQGEKKTIRFTCVDSDGDAEDMSGVTALQFLMKRRKGQTTANITKNTVSFDTSQAVSGILDLPVTLTDDDDSVLVPDIYTGQLNSTFSATSLDKSADITIEIEESV